MLGTMRYMSPEQASGRAVVLDQRTDIYSLGVTLYELFTLERAFPGITHEELLRQVAQDDPKPARAIDKTIPREMEIILAKTMAKDPADRYSSARLLADDLRRFMQEEPIPRPPAVGVGSNRQVDSPPSHAGPVGSDHPDPRHGRSARQHRVDRPRAKPHPRRLRPRI